jgi:DNA-directed RNA polymerase subunit E'/Rpb7
MHIFNPYTDEKLKTIVAIKADQMDNRIYNNLKKNLEYKLLGKCFKNYGVITKIYKITKYNEGRIQAENFSASAEFEVEFNCRLCLPLNNKDIICEISQIQKALIIAKNGPITILIQSSTIDEKILKIDNLNNYIYKDKKTGEIKKLDKGSHIVIKISQIKFHNGDKTIICLGLLVNIPEEETIKKYYDMINAKTSEEADVDNKDRDFIVKKF